jgi:tyrosyl-tRNA synthetase
MFMPLLVGLDGEKKMSKSLGNYIGIAETPIDQYSKVMSLADTQMQEYFLLCTDVPEAQYKELLQTVSNPMDAKHRLGWEIVNIYHGKDAAQTAQDEWKRIHSKGELPSNMPTLTPSENPIGLVKLIIEAGFAQSNSEARRLIEQGGVTIDGVKQADPKAIVSCSSEQVLKVGKKNYAKIAV